MHYRSHAFLFIALLIKTCVLVLYVTTDEWKILLYFGYSYNNYGAIYNETKNRTLVENTTLILQRNLPEKETGESMKDKMFLNTSAFKYENSLNVGFNNMSMDVQSGTFKATGGVSNSDFGARKESLYQKQSTKISDIENGPSHGAVSGETNVRTGHYFVCPEPYGRLGNMMFQYAASVGIAHYLHYKPVINPYHTLLKYFEMSNMWKDTPTNVLTIKEEQWKDREWRNNKTFLSHNLTIFGYFQSWKYFQNISDQIRNSFKLNPCYLEKARTFLKENIPGLKERVGIHIRRTDFQTEVAVEEGRVVASKEYIKKAMHYFRTSYEEVFFIVVSDDLQWCRQNVVGDDVIFSPFGQPITDMAIMSLCDHMIITVGSFSWWGGWLSGGTVVYLKDFPRSGSLLEIGIKKDEYYLPEWIGLSNE